MLCPGMGNPHASMHALDGAQVASLCPVPSRCARHLAHPSRTVLLNDGTPNNVPIDSVLNCPERCHLGGAIASKSRKARSACSKHTPSLVKSKKQNTIIKLLVTVSHMFIERTE